MSVTTGHIVDTSIRQKVRLLMLLNAARAAGLTPLPILRLHIMAYLSDVLSPVWHLIPYNGKVLKRKEGPFFPELQYDLDRLVGRGLVRVENIGHVSVGQDRVRLDTSYSINPDLASTVLEFLDSVMEERVVADFMRELALAISAMNDEEIDRAFNQDATYSNNHIGMGNVVDFAEWTNTNFSASAAERIGQLVPTDAQVGPGEKVHLYFRHLRQRLHGGN